MSRISQILANTTTIFRRCSAGYSISALLVILYIHLLISHDSSLFGLPQHPFSRPATNILDRISPRIWQIFFGYTPLDNFVPSLETWIANNQDYAYTLVSSEGGDAFARKHYADRLEILQTFLDLSLPVFRSDLLRYMILESEGGIYSDLDTDAIKSVRDWIPEELRSKIHVVVGIEYDQLDNKPFPGMTERLQICQWTMAASKGHPIMRNIVKEVVKGLHAMAKTNNTTIAELRPLDHEVLEISGPLIWTKVILQYLSEATATHVDYRNLTGMKEARVFSDVMVLPIDGFGSGQDHSNSTRVGESNAYARHQWRGSWKHDWNG